jgi:hypothetical protein
MNGVVGQDVIAAIVAPPQVVLQGWTLGARIEVPVTRAIVSYWRPATIASDGASWSVILESPPDPGDYELVWRTNDPEPPVYEAYVPLHVLSEEAGADIDDQFPTVDRTRITPTSDDVAQLERTRTVDQGGNDLGIFTGTTRPTDAECEDLIEQAIDDVLAELPDTFMTRHYDSVKRAITLYAAVLVEASYYREEVAANTPAMTYQDRYERSIAGLLKTMDSDRTSVSIATHGLTTGLA